MSAASVGVNFRRGIVVKASDELRVTELFNTVSGAYINANFYLDQDERRTTRLRRLLTAYHQKGQRYLVCAQCFGAVYLKGGLHPAAEQQLHFSHYQSPEYESCPLNDKNKSVTPEQIRAIKYDGVQESRRHFRLKNMLGLIMEQDNDCKIVIVDKCYRKREKHERRRPDVQCEYKSDDVVFEIQLSTEFVPIINEREEYYREKGAFLLWIFDSESSKAIMNQSQKDIYYLNNSNAFCLDQEAIYKSLQSKKLNLKVRYDYPEIEGDQIVSRQAPLKMITIDDITFDRKSLSAYYVNFDSKFQEYKRLLIHKKLTSMIQNEDRDGINKYLSRISDISSPFGFDVYKFVLYMLSAKESRDIHRNDSSKYISYCQMFLNPHGNGKLFPYFYSIVKCHGHDLPDGKGIETIPVKAKAALNDLRRLKGNSRFYPNPRCQELFAFLFPTEYQWLLKLIDWAGIQCKNVDCEKFNRLELY